MHSSAYVLAVLASWTGLAAAAPPAQLFKPTSWASTTRGAPVPSTPSPSSHSGPSSPSSPGGSWEGASTICYTKMDTSSVLWNTATSWTTRWKPCTTTLTSTVTTTTTPVTTSTLTVTSTSVTTSTVSTSTTTVAAPATFTPVQTSLPGSTYSGSGGTDPISKREAQLGRRHDHQRSSKPGICAWRYPRGVTCHHWVPEQCSTTITTTTTTVAAPTQTVTTNSTTVTTSTTTTYLSTTTLYAACATNNLADTYTGGEHFIEGEGGFETVDSTTADSAYDCCVAALLDNGGDTNVWVYEPSTGECDIGETDSTCPNPATNPSTVITSPSGTLVIGNAYCGEFAIAEPEFSGAPK